MNVNAINTPNFQARLDISKVKTNKVRWQNIAKLFKEETKLIPNETVKIVEHELDTSIIGAKYAEMPNIGKIEALTFNKTMKELLEKYDDSIIAKKLKKLLNIADVVEGRKAKAFDKYQAMSDRQSWVSKDILLNKRNAEYEAIETAAQNKAKKDAFWRNFEIVV